MKTTEKSGSPVRGVTCRRPAGRKLAEWFSLGASALLILVLAGFLAHEAFKANAPQVPVEVGIKWNEVREVGGRFILPVEIVNRGEQTLRDLNVQLQYQPSGAAEPETREVVIDYLGERSETTLYFYFDQPPDTLQVESRPVSYRLD